MILYSTRMPPFTVLLADDAETIRFVVKRILAPETGIKLLGEAT
jgi:hypothetical protein